jgi:hypothetical protein
VQRPANGPFFIILFINSLIFTSMFWQEKVDRLKKWFSPTDFRVPFTDGSSILKNMEARFVISAKPQYQRTNWAEGLKDPIVIITLEMEDVFAAISALDRATNYWVVVVLGEASMAERLVYDCRPAAMGRLTAIAPGDFFIGDKQYGWLVYFKCDLVENTVTLIKAGNFVTPFENQQ